MPPDDDMDKINMDVYTGSSFKEGEQLVNTALKTNVISPGDTDLFRTHVQVNPEATTSLLSPEEVQEAAELDFTVIDSEGEFMLTTCPPLLTSIIKLGVLHSCAPMELLKGAMCRWDPVVVVVTEKSMFIHSITDENILITHTDTMLLTALQGDIPKQSFLLNEIDCNLISHPIFSDAFEITALQQSSALHCSTKLCFLTKNTSATSDWLDAISQNASADIVLSSVEC